ncbi:hypothetical protein B7R70_07785 [Yersinia pseudotuberculosis]|uniref:Tc1-like transposase DDE domain-containing protein n=1 Tax=Yersinia pseudotuberculosis serotype I (strain IP32953) TaxID=273123 RepID=Q66EX9_YERPS|nr:hypothetical protein B7R70_07785 [Yersinia pseudotuberculosis]CAH19802.1 hypothetical protein YPTB0562 [Yersinia pseudotuberculosis IP 32953]
MPKRKKSNLVKDWAFVTNIKPHELPPYSPNLNAIERLWKVMNEHTRNNRYIEKTDDFHEAIYGSFSTTLTKIVDSLSPK